MGTKTAIETKDTTAGIDLVREFAPDNEVIADPIELNTRFLAPGTKGGDLYSKEIAFMEEKVTFMIAETTDKTAEIVVSVSVNCETKLLERGKPYTLPRKFLNALIARKGEVATENYKDKDGVDQTRTRIKYMPVHAITVLDDPSGANGRAWFEWQCRNA